MSMLHVLRLRFRVGRGMTSRDTADLAFIRSDVLAMSGYTPGEQPGDARVVKLNTNENPYPPSPRVREAIAAAAADGLRLYPDPMASELCARAARVYGLQPDQVLAGNGSDELLMMIIRACVGPADRVVFPVPTYTLYETLVQIGGGRVATVDFPADFALPVDELVAAAGRVTFLCNPNAPSGTLASTSTLGELAQRLAGLVVVDEAYVDFAEGSAVELIAEHANVVVTRTFSKSFSLAGLRVGLLFGRAEVVSELAKVKDSYNLNRISMAAATAALEDLPWMRANVDKVRATRARLSDELRALGYEVLPSQANFVLARRRGEDQRPVYDALHRAGVLVRYFATPQLHDALRITVGTDAEIDRFLHALRAG